MHLSWSAELRRGWLWSIRARRQSPGAKGGPRFWFLAYYKEFDLHDDPAFDRVRRWRDACLAQPEAQQVSYDEIVKLYYDHAVGLGNGALAEGRQRSSFVFGPHWRDRPMPPRDKYDRIASDEELGLI